MIYNSLAVLNFPVIDSDGDGAVLRRSLGFKIRVQGSRAYINARLVNEWYLVSPIFVFASFTSSYTP